MEDRHTQGEKSVARSVINEAFVVILQVEVDVFSAGVRDALDLTSAP